MDFKKEAVEFIKDFDSALDREATASTIASLAEFKTIYYILEFAVKGLKESSKPDMVPDAAFDNREYSE